jgi:hypothetical protein
MAGNMENARSKNMMFHWPTTFTKIGSQFFRARCFLCCISASMDLIYLYAAGATRGWSFPHGT